MTTGRGTLATVACALGAALCWTLASQPLGAHGSDARLVRDRGRSP
jgi:hypothetical protein